jgi:putative ABC transport system substrate-binding protein
MRSRREFITLLGGAATSWPLTATAQPSEHKRRVGLLMGLAESDPDTIGYVQELRRTLQTLGWTEGQNLEFFYGYASGDPERARMLATELVARHPDVIVAHTTPVAAALHQATRTIPVVFVSIADPVVSGFATSFARPGGNLTGFTNYEFTMGAKWLEIIKEIAPRTTRVSLMLNPDSGAFYVEYLRSVDTVALSAGVQATLAPARGPDEIERVIVALAREPGGGLIVLPSAPITAHSRLINRLAIGHRLPTMYPFRAYAAQGGLVSYGINLPDLFGRAAHYVDRILRGSSPSEMPVQAPTRYELVINLKTAKALGLDVPATLLARADEVIE